MVEVINALANLIEKSGVTIAAFTGLVVMYLKMRGVGAKVDEVHKATNGLVKKLVDQSEVIGHEQGVKEEKERTESRDRSAGGS